MRKFILLFLTMLLVAMPFQVFAAEDTTPSGIPLSQMEPEIDNFINQIWKMFFHIALLHMELASCLK
jgi:hypothetical protein